MSENVSTKAITHTGKRLPNDFILGENDVYVGRINLYRYHPGNVRFNELVQEKAQRYCTATNRIMKTSIIYEIIDSIRTNSPNGGFVKRDTKSGLWYEVGDIVAVRNFFFFAF
jgi:hypothetical protein